MRNEWWKYTCDSQVLMGLWIVDKEFEINIDFPTIGKRLGLFHPHVKWYMASSTVVFITNHVQNQSPVFFAKIIINKWVKLVKMKCNIFLPSVTSCFENRGFVGFESPFNHRVACYCHYLTWWSLLSKRSCLSCEQRKFPRKSRNEFQSFTKKIQKKRSMISSTLTTSLPRFASTL